MNRLLQLTVVLIFVILFIHPIFSDGMFFDGVVYASVAKNYAHGIGSFWQMQYTGTLHTPYHEQPPFMFFLQACFFRLLGDSIYVERIYCFTFLLGTIALYTQLWKEVNYTSKSNYWLAMLLCLIVPVCSWAYQNNVEEVTMCFFDACAVLFLLKGCRKQQIRFILLGSGFVFLASFCKGIQGLFPLMVPLLHYLAYRQFAFRRSVSYSILATSVPAIVYICFYYYPPAHLSYSMYFERRLMGSFHHQQDTTGSHFHLLYQLFCELLPTLGVTFLLWLATRKKMHLPPANRKSILLLLLIAITASFPLMITQEQRGFYLVTSLPYYCMALGVLAQESFEVLPLNRVSFKTIRVINTILILLIATGIVLSALYYRIPKREKELIADIAIIKNVIPAGATVSIPQSLFTSWHYHAYLMRYCGVTLDPNHKFSFLITKKGQLDGVVNEYKKLPLSTSELDVYSK
jgi:4-amino-4-deoxy-L-arabinose transferase-like glycosyltransferase